MNQEQLNKIRKQCERCREYAGDHDLIISLVDEIERLNKETAEKYKDKDTRIVELTNENLKLLNQIENSVKLPCKIGDVVFVITADNDMYQSNALSFFVWKDNNQKINVNINYHYKHGKCVSILQGEYGVKVFTDKQQAEKKLKERDNNG